MSLYDVHLGIVFVFFVYGLAFFTLGIALALEIGRSPMLAERRVLLPLAIFGMMHGVHEWLEVIIVQGVWVGSPFPVTWSWLRVGWLTLSFVPLVAFGAGMLQARLRLPGVQVYASAVLLGLDLLLVAYYAQAHPETGFAFADVLARYTLATPGGILAGLALLTRAQQMNAEGRKKLAQRFQWAALVFVFYGLTHIIVPSTDIFLARRLNAELFLSVTGFPVQVLRAVLAVLATVSLLQAIHLVDQERSQRLLAAQNARVAALEQMQREMEEREVLRRQLLRHTVIGQEEERKRIARELHDETAQILTAFTLNLGVLKKSTSRNRACANQIIELQNLSQQLSQSLYRIVHALRPSQLDDLGLVPALQYLVDDGRARLGLEITLTVEGRRQRVDPFVETVVFRVAQESINNIGRHAQIHEAALRLCFNARSVNLWVQDLGVGFNANEVFSPPRGWGLAGMRERAESVGGQFKVLSAPGSGTILEISIPLAENSNL